MDSYNGKKYYCPRCGQPLRIVAGTPEGNLIKLSLVCPNRAGCGYIELKVVEREK